MLLMTFHPCMVINLSIIDQAVLRALWHRRDLPPVPFKVEEQEAHSKKDSHDAENVIFHQSKQGIV